MIRQINDAGLALIKSFEGFRAQPYQDAGGVWTIGYGHTDDVTADTPSITEAEATLLLQQDLSNVEAMVDTYVEASLNDNQFAALVSLTYNCGTAPLHGTLGELLNVGNFKDAINEFQKWDHVNGKTIVGLTKRRYAEKALFMEPCNENSPTSGDTASV